MADGDLITTDPVFEELDDDFERVALYIDPVTGQWYQLYRRKTKPATQRESEPHTMNDREND